TALKLLIYCLMRQICFETIRNSTALKHTNQSDIFIDSFETIRNSTALKPRRLFFVTKSRNLAIRLSQTSVSNSF
ncbi:TPA: hypothetical protein ACGO3Z_002158, partial [Streptococcus suis]